MFLFLREKVGLAERLHVSNISKHGVFLLKQRPSGALGHAFQPTGLGALSL